MQTNNIALADLRKGNIISDGALLFGVSEILHNSLWVVNLHHDTGKYGIDAENVFGGKLTEKMLFKLGFEKESYKDGFIGKKSKLIDFVLTYPKHDGTPSDYFTFHYSVGRWPLFQEFEYIHQLQNFYFALYGTELTLK